MPADKTWPWEKSKLNVETFNRFERAKYKNGVETGLGVLANGTLQAGAFVVNGYHWVEDSDVVSAFDFSSLLNQPSQEIRKLYAQYNYTATDPHANVVYGYATTLPSNAIQLGVITVPASSVSITQGMISTIDANRDLSNRYLSEHAIIDSDTRIPTQNQKDALAGMGVSPSNTNRFATQADLPVVSGDNLGNHAATQNINFNNFKGVNCATPVSSSDVANKQFVLDNVGGQNLASSISHLRKHMMEMQLTIEGITNSPYPDNYGQPFFRTEFEDYGNFVEVDGKQVFQSDNDLTKLTADIITNKRAERGRVDTRLQLPKQHYFGEVIRYNHVPDIANKPHAITYCPDDYRIYMITRGDNANDTVLHRINMISLQVEGSWFFEENTFTRWNGIAAGITYGNGQLYIVEYDPTNLGAVCIRFKVDALPPQGVRITKSNVGAIESANSIDSFATEVFHDIAYDAGRNLVWALKYKDVSDHKLVRLKTDFIENGTLAYDANTVNTSSMDTAINGIDYDGDFIWFTGETWSGRMSVNGAVNARWKRYGKTGICYINDNNLPSVSGQIFNTDKVDLKMWAIAIRNTQSLPTSATYKPIHAVANITSVNYTTKEVTLARIDGAAPTFAVNEFKNFHMRVGNVYWMVASNTTTTVTLDTQLDISGLSGMVELGTVRKNFATTLTTSGMKVWSYEGGTDNVNVTSTGFMLDKDTEVGSIGIELGVVTAQGNIELRIETNNNGAPSGTLAHANATTTIASGNLVANSWNIKAFASTFTLSKNTIYHVKITNSATCQVKGHVGGFNNYGTQSDVMNIKVFSGAKLAVDVVSDVATSNNRLYVGYKQAAGTTEYKPDGTAGMDSYIDEATATTNYGNDTLVKVACNQGTGGNTDTWTLSFITQRNDSAMVFSANKLYVFGGWDTQASAYKNDLWEYDITTSAWTQKTSGSTARGGCSSWLYNGKMYLFGGHTGSLVNDLWEYDISTDTWSQKSPTGGPPQARSSSPAIVYSGKAYIFGGGAGGGGYTNLNDVWELDLTTFVWTQKSPTGGPPSQRNGHTNVLNAGKMYIFGGSIGGSRLNDTWELNLTTFVWTQKSTTGGPPGTRYGHSANAYGGKMYVHGGWAMSSGYDDVWELDLTTFTWTQKTSSSIVRNGHAYANDGANVYIFGGGGMNDLRKYDITGNSWSLQSSASPVARNANTAVVHGTKMYVFGGHNGTSGLNDLWEYDLTTFLWTQRTSGATARWGGASVVYNGKLYIFGGQNPTYLNDLWECDLTTFVWTQKTSGATARTQCPAVLNGSKMYVFGGQGASVLGDFWECDLTTFTWTSRTSGASSRSLSSAVVNGGKMYLFGGNNGTACLNDLWECDLTTFTWTQKTSGATIRKAHTAVVHSGKMYIFGGNNTSNSDAKNDLWECDLSTFVWTQKTSGASVRAYHVAVVNASKMYVFSGYNGTTNYNDLWVYTITGTGGSVTKQRGVIKFDLTSLPGAVNSATLSLYLDSANAASKTIQIHKLTEDPTEAEVTWNKRNSATNWTTAGWQFDASPLVSQAVTNSAGYVSFDITTLYNQWKANTVNNYGLAIKLSDEVTTGNYVYFASSDNADANKRPKLVVSANPTNYNVGVFTRDKIADVGYGGAVTQALNISDQYLFVGLSNEIRILDVSDNTVLQVLNNTSYPGITSTVINDMAAKRLVADEYTQKIHQYLVVACNNGVSIINMTTGTSFPIYNYELESNSAACKKVAITDDGKLVIVTETATPNVFQIDIFGDITKIYTSNTNKTWEAQTGLRRTLKGPSNSGVLPSDVVKAVDTRTIMDSLLGYNTNLILIASGSNLCEYDVTKEKLRVIDTVSGMTCYDVAYFQDTINAIYTDGSTDGVYKQYDTYYKRLNYAVGKNSSSHSRLNFESWNLQKLKILENKVVVITTASGIELLDLTFKDTNSFGKAVWQSAALHDANGIARATAMIRGFRLPRELVTFSTNTASGVSSLSVNQGTLGSLISKGDTLYLYSTSETSSGNGEKVLVASSYDESSGTIPLESTTLAENIDESSTVIKLDSKSVVDAMPVQGVIKIGSEQMLYNGKSGQNVLVTARGINGTTPASHSLNDAVNTVLRFDYRAGDEVVFVVNKKRIDKLVDMRVMESADGVTYTEGNQVVINDVDTGYYNEAVRSDLPYGQVKLSLNRTDYVGDTVAVDNVSVYWENY